MRNTYNELATQFTKKELEERLEELNLKFSQMLMMPDIQSITQEREDIQFLLGKDVKAK